jgi:adenine/guanine phosphoribosyltransferase-like PRPP-binding protein
MIEKFVDWFEITERFVDWEEYLKTTEVIVELINCNIYHGIKQNKLDFVYGIPRGGLIPATILSYKFNIPILNYTSQDIITEPEKKLICIVDDILDSGKTLDGTLHMLLSRGFKNFVVFTLFAKPKGILYFLNSSWKDINYYIKEIPNDLWIHFPYEQNPVVRDSLSNIKQPGT